MTQKHTQEKEKENIKNDIYNKILEDIKSEISFNNERETVAIMARIRKRLGKTCYLDWNPENWKIFIDKLINDLKVNVVMIGIKSKANSSSGASLTFNNSEFIKNIKPSYLSTIMSKYAWK